jgi:hypothetical protein
MHLSRWLGAHRTARNSSSGRVRTLRDATRYASTLLRQLPLQPLVAALIMSLVLGILPMILTALCSAALTVLDWCRCAGLPSHHPLANKSRRVELINPLELL